MKETKREAETFSGKNAASRDRAPAARSPYRASFGIIVIIIIIN